MASEAEAVVLLQRFRWRAVLMTHVQRPSLRLVLLLAALLLPASAARACSCLWGSATDALRRSDAVFVGRPIAFRPSLLHPLGEEVTRFAVERTWKGDVRREVLVVAVFRDGCGVEFSDDGSRYIVFAAQDRWGRLTTRWCTGTQLLELAARDVAELGAGRAPPAGGALDPWPSIAVSGVIVLLGLLLVGALRQRRAGAGER